MDWFLPLVGHAICFLLHHGYVYLPLWGQGKKNGVMVIWACMFVPKVWNHLDATYCDFSLTTAKEKYKSTKDSKLHPHVAFAFHNVAKWWCFRKNVSMRKVRKPTLDDAWCITFYHLCFFPKSSCKFRVVMVGRRGRRRRLLFQVMHDWMEPYTSTKKELKCCFSLWISVHKINQKFQTQKVSNGQPQTDTCIATWLVTTWIGCIEHVRTRSYSSISKEIESQRDLFDLDICHCHHDPDRHRHVLLLCTAETRAGARGCLLFFDTWWVWV
jgi:hypothetical protein